MTNVDTIIPWSRWTSALVSALYPNGMGQGTQFSFGSTSRYVDLVDPNPQVTNYSIYQIGDAIPSDSPNYGVMASGLALSYDLFLQNIDLGGSDDPNLQGLLDAAANEMNAAQGGYNTAFTNAAAQYNIMTKDEKNPPSLRDWAATNYPGLSSAQNELDGAAAKYNELATKAYGAGYKALLSAKQMAGYSGGALDQLSSTQYNMKAASGTVVPVGAQKTLPGGDSATTPKSNLKAVNVPAYVLDPSLAKDYVTWQSNSVNDKTVQTIKYSEGHADSDFKEAGWSAQAASHWDGWFVNVKATASGQQKTVSIDTSASEFDMSVSFAGFGMYGLNPGSWYQNGAMIGNYKDKLLPSAPNYYAPDGPLARRASAVALGFVPTVKLTMSAADYHSFKTAWSTAASLSVSVGPFGFEGSGSGGRSNANMTFDDASSSVVMGPVKSTMPVLLGVESQML